jgi:hypothetical protein
MPRQKFPKPKPLETYFIESGLMSVEFEVWANKADAGERGSWRMRKASAALDILIKAYEDRLLNPFHSRSVSEIALKRLLGKRQTSKLVEEIRPILKKNRFEFQKTALWSLAEELQTTFIAIRNGIASNQSTLPHLPVNSEEARIRDRMLKGTF